ncbi:oligosaccharide flippase family protein [Aquabacter sp. CN5-332]|uniref:oligosaccharide flippase family protein n=1 Tax=Aquabacter sp. CN5-332 TaxID=3156608 RepID=UPI0032B6268A
MSVRRAFLFSVSERYVVMGANFLMVAIVARVLTPEEFGFAVVGAAILAVVESFRDFGALSFIVQRKELEAQEARTAATIMLATTLLIAAIVWVAAAPLADFYERDGLRPYLQVIALTLLAGPLTGPLIALLQRDMHFGSIAIINVATALTTAAGTLAMALLGASYMSFAWGGAAGAAVGAVLAMALRRDFWIFRPSLRDWRTTLSFGSYWTATGLLNKIYDYVPSLVLGRSLGFEAMGLYSRAAMVSQLPDKCLLAGLLPIALPAMAAEAREGRSLKTAYLLSLTYITVMQWPALLLLAFLAHPVVLILLGDQWLGIVPLVQIMSLALLPSFLTMLAYPLLVAAGGVRDAFLATLVAVPLCTLVAGAAALYGLEAAALSMFATAPIQTIIWLHVIRRRVPCQWREIAGALAGSIVVCASSAVVPAVVLALNGFSFELSIPAAIVSAIGAVAGWALALVRTRHPFRSEIDHMGKSARSRLAAARAAGMALLSRRRLRARGVG